MTHEANATPRILVDTSILIDFYQDRRPFSDCLVSLAAEKVGADFLVTRDARGFERSRVPALSPQELFDYLERERGITYDTMDW